jgi:pimeloyl-ACP methyl ester carboxylesterase
VNFVRRGSGRPPLLFVHGFSCALEDWQAQIEFFSPRHEVVACDLRSHGATPGRAAECSIEHYGGDVAALVNNLGLSGCFLVGHSMGTRVILEAARIDPERVAGLILIDGSRQGSGDPDDADAAVRATIEAMGYSAFREHAVRQMFFVWSPVAEHVLRRSEELSADAGAALWPRMARWDASRLEEALGAVRVPLMVIQTTFLDASRKRAPLKAGQSTPYLDLIRSKVPGARIEVLPGVGHFPQLEVPGEVNRLIADFLKEART